MRILFFSNIFPQPNNRMRGIYCLRLCHALTARHQVQVVSPWSWVDRLRYRRASPADHDFAADLRGLQVHYPWYFYPPGGLRSTYGWFMGISAWGRLRKVLADF